MPLDDTITALDQMVLQFDGDPHPAAKILYTAALTNRNTLMDAVGIVHTDDEKCWRHTQADDPCPACEYREIDLDIGPVVDAWRVSRLRDPDHGAGEGRRVATRSEWRSCRPCSHVPPALRLQDRGPWACERPRTVAWPWDVFGALQVRELRRVHLRTLVRDLELVLLRAPGVGEAVDDVPGPVVSPLGVVRVK